MNNKLRVEAYGFVADGTMTLTMSNVTLEVTHTFGGMVTNDQGEEQSYLVAIGVNEEDLADNIENILKDYLEAELVCSGKLVYFR